MEERMGLRRANSRLRAMPEVRGTLHISLVWLVFYVVLLGHGLISHKTAATAVTSADQQSDHRPSPH